MPDLVDNLMIEATWEIEKNPAISDSLQPQNKPVHRSDMKLNEMNSALKSDDLLILPRGAELSPVSSRCQVMFRMLPWNYLSGIRNHDPDSILSMFLIKRSGGSAVQ
jgi:hypothetical protein